MMNYIALYVLYFIGETKADWNLFLQETSSRPVFVNFSDTVAFPTIKIGAKFELNICFILALIIGIIIFIYLNFIFMVVCIFNISIFCNIIFFHDNKFCTFFKILSPTSI